MSDDATFRLVKIQHTELLCVRCAPATKTPAIAWVKVRDQVAVPPVSSQIKTRQFPVCREHGLEVQKEAAGTGATVEIQEL